MNKYPDYISTKRRPAASPDKLVDNGQAIFGTFISPLKDINLLDCKKPAGRLLPHCMNKIRFTKWEAFEIMFDEGALISAVYNMGVIGFSLFVFFDRLDKKVYNWINFAPCKRCIVAPNLIDSVTELATKKSLLRIENQFQEGACRAEGFANNKKCGSIEFDVSAKRISPPSIVSIPFGSNKPLYSEKDFFSAEGYLIINGRKISANASTTVIVDDHKGYYPFKMHYDWLTTMGKCSIGDEEKYLAINLTYNQSMNQDDYNENILWLQGESHPLPPIGFEKLAKDKWRIKDKYGAVDIVFEIENKFDMMMHLGLLDISYSLPFGKVYGYVRDTKGSKYSVDGMCAIGEDKSTRI